MQKIRAFFYVSLGILALSVAFHFGAQTAQSQSGDEVVRTEMSSGDRNYIWVVTRSGDAFLLSSRFVEKKMQVQVLAKGNIHDAPIE
jgi:hypothetical protein